MNIARRRLDDADDLGHALPKHVYWHIRFGPGFVGRERRVSCDFVDLVDDASHLLATGSLGHAKSTQCNGEPCQVLPGPRLRWGLDCSMHPNFRLLRGDSTWPDVVVVVASKIHTVVSMKITTGLGADGYCVNTYLRRLPWKSKSARTHS